MLIRILGIYWKIYLKKKVILLLIIFHTHQPKYIIFYKYIYIYIYILTKFKKYIRKGFSLNKKYIFFYL